jgi:hypothetical protein
METINQQEQTLPARLEWEVKERNVRKQLYTELAQGAKGIYRIRQRKCASRFLRKKNGYSLTFKPNDQPDFFPIDDFLTPNFAKKHAETLELSGEMPAEKEKSFSDRVLHDKDFVS